MKIIAHRGNLNGPDPNKENTIDYLDIALSTGFDVEVDIWFIEGNFYLGHDKPLEKVTSNFLQNMWIHAKNAVALEPLLDLGIHCFFHNNDDAVFTSQGYIWCLVGKPLCGSKCICVLPEIGGVSSEYYGICTDYSTNPHFSIA